MNITHAVHLQATTIGIPVVSVISVTPASAGTAALKPPGGKLQYPFKVQAGIRRRFQSE